MSLREAQRGVLLRMLQLSGEELDPEEWSDEWKVLILDQFSRNVISPVLTVGDLRRLGVTLTLSLEAKRDPIPDVPAVYFVKPSVEMASTLANDISSGLYDLVHLHWSSPCPRDVLEQLAKACFEAGCAKRIASVWDTYMAYTCLKDRLFVSNLTNSFATFSASNASEEAIERHMNEVADSLLCALVTTGTVPVICAPPGGAAEMVAEKLHSRIKAALDSKDNPFSTAVARRAGKLSSSLRAGSSMGDRTILVISDRTMDMRSPFLHSSVYEDMLDDVVGIHLNRVAVDIAQDGTVTPSVARAGTPGVKSGPGAGRNGAKREVFDLDPEHDPFWRSQSGALFPEAVEENEKELGEVTARESEIRAGGSGNADETTDSLRQAGIGMDSDKTLLSAVTSLPAIMERKRKLQMHTTLLRAVMSEVAARDLPSFCDVEEGALDKAKVLKLLASGKGNFEDRLRLAAILLLTEGVPKGDVDKAIEAVVQQPEGKEGRKVPR